MYGNRIIRIKEIQDSLNFQTALTGSAAIMIYLEYMYEMNMIDPEDYSNVKLKYNDYDFIATADKSDNIYVRDILVGDDLFVSEQMYPQRGKTFTFNDESFDLLLIGTKFSYNEIFGVKVLTPIQLKSYYVEYAEEIADNKNIDYKIALLDFIIENINLGPGKRYKSEKKEVIVSGRKLNFD